eukprot:12285380-Alexandrium_andersonii.AAC.1
MSASLVGSEMCIRDRCEDGQQLYACYLHLGAMMRCTCRNMPIEVARCDHCLLYTSDAADDM